MTSIERPSRASSLSADLRELAPWLAGEARHVVVRAASLLDAQADLLALTVPAAEHGRVVEQLAAHHERTTNVCQVCGWEHPSAREARRITRWRTKG